MVKVHAGAASLALRIDSLEDLVLYDALPGDLATQLIHLPGLRGNPARTYQITRATAPYPGRFDVYAASVLLNWQEASDPKAECVGRDMLRLGLTSHAQVKRIVTDDSRVELQVGRTHTRPIGPSDDLVNIADVGFGVSQVLPVVVALHAANPGQVLHIEQPELHLHPKAQAGMADLLVDCARRGVILLVETHAPIIILALQVAVAEGVLSPRDVALNWFTRDPESGATKISPGVLDSNGAYEDWPIDFTAIESQWVDRYLDAVQKRM